LAVLVSNCLFENFYWQFGFGSLLVREKVDLFAGSVHFFFELLSFQFYDLDRSSGHA
jgi:hypothetical protein